MIDEVQAGQLQSWILPRGFDSVCLHQFLMADVLGEPQVGARSRWLTEVTLLSCRYRHACTFVCCSQETQRTASFREHSSL